MTTTFELIMKSRELVAEGSQGFDDDSGFDGWLGKLDGLLAESSDKLLACRCVVDDAEAEAEKLRALASKIEERAKRFDAIANRVKDKAQNLAVELSAVDGRTKFDLGDGGKVTIVTRKDLKVDVADVNALPFQYQKVKDPVADVTAIKAAHKLGQQVLGATVTEVQTTYLKWS